MKLYHGTTEENSTSIQRTGFEDSEGSYGMWREVGEKLTPLALKGVWFSNVPLDGNEGLPAVEDHRFFIINIPAKEIRDFEVIEEGKGYREWCIPAKLVNRYFSDSKIHTRDEVE